MKLIKWLIIFIFISTLTLISCAVSTGDKIIGKWKFIDSQGEQGFMVFDKYGYFKILDEEEVIVGKDDLFLSMKYKTDYTKEPNALDFILSFGNSGQLSSRSEFIMEFITQDEIKLGGTFDDTRPRPERFDLLDKKDVVVLIRVKEVP